jgi:O-antigen/teichoic acid export membrane protein
LKKIFLLACLFVALAPRIAKAEDHDRDDRRKHHIRASEMAGVGLGAAALVGVAGYLILRRRHSS